MKALAVELPVVTTRIVGVPEPVEDGTDGLLVPPVSLDRLVERLVGSPEERHPDGESGAPEDPARL
jgi:glycosyltransferase involved in cell wall biosynthesis